MKDISILGSTGSIGCNVLKIVEMFPDKFNIKALAAGKNINLLARQIEKFNPEIAVVFNKSLKSELKSKLQNKNSIKILHGEEGYIQAASYSGIDMLIMAMMGASGLKPTISGISAGKNIAIANKETLVMAGELVMTMAHEKGVQLLPIDSEHSAIFQSMQGHRKEEISKIILTASGGPFLKKKSSDFSKIKPEEALCHPTWQMGKKISIDSATLMNKGLEVIEAKHLFNIPEEKIEVLIHPQSIIHSMVAYHDGSVISQMSVPDMKGAIAYAMSYPQRLPLVQPKLDLHKIGALTFDVPDFEKFPCLKLAFYACKIGHTFPCALNAANEITVEAFLSGRISFDKIPEYIEKTLQKHLPIKNPSLEDIFQIDLWAREQTYEFISGG
ncbi:MAG: 1-deoxy-D-xylulose-5-phosphate reductoisomerase [Desulfobacterales bacterium]|nr:1-deoxy-D-xylulose-5-phosphate reductoisomerase [Desulfobacterales bacterium]